jgi:hypothetical protein
MPPARTPRGSSISAMAARVGTTRTTSTFTSAVCAGDLGNLVYARHGVTDCPDEEGVATHSRAGEWSSVQERVIRHDGGMGLASIFWIHMNPLSGSAWARPFLARPGVAAPESHMTRPQGRNAPTTASPSVSPSEMLASRMTL